MNTRSIELENFRAEQSENELIIEGYFSVFDKPYHISADAYETVGRNAFDDIDGTDVRALINHDTTLVLGRTITKTLELRVDETGLFGRIHINPKDTDAMNIYERVKRGDVSQCSFGFEILDESTEFLENGSVHWTLNKVRLFEVSICTYPAYEDTEVHARSAEAEELRAVRSKKAELLTILKEA